MTTGATGQLGLALPVQGELSGTWGDTVNNGITEYTNIAIAATLTLTNDGAVTLANTTGDASASNITSSLTGAGTVTAQFAIVKVTGTLTTAKVITAPSYSKTYVVVNAATGGIVTFKASGQTGVSIAVGESAWVYYNGTDYVKIAGTTSGAAGGSNTQVQYNSSGSLAGSSNLTFDGTSLTLGGNPTLSAGTANGVTYLNGSKVLTSGSALTFDGTTLSLTTAGTNALTINTPDYGYFDLKNGTSTLRLQNNNSIPRVTTVGNYPLVFAINESEQMRLTSTGLGIGTSSPASKLQVTSANGAVTLDSGTGESHYIDITHKGSYSDLGGIRFNQGSTTYGNNQILFRAMDSGGTVQTVMTLNGAGNLGLGVTPSPWSLKAIEVGSVGNGLMTGGVSDFWMTSNAYYNSGWKYAGTNLASGYEQTAGKHIWLTAASGTAGNAISFTQAMTLDANGLLQVGATSPINSGAVTFASSGGTYNQLELCDTRAYSSTPNSSLGFAVKYNSAGSYTNMAAIVGTKENATDGNYSGALLFYTSLNGSGSAERARITSTGGFSVGTTADPGAGAIYATGNITAYYSDDRLKTRLGNIENALDKVDQLQGFYYEANETAQALGYKVKREVGVSAQSVQAVLPEIVSPAPIDQQYLTVDYERLVPLLIEAVKELTAKVKALEAK